MKNKIIYILTIIVSVVLIFLGNRAFVNKNAIFSGDTETFTGVVTEIKNRTEEDIYIGEQNAGKNITITFLCEIGSGLFSKETVECNEYISALDGVQIKEVAVGDRVIISRMPETEGWFLYDYERLTPMLWLCAIFIILILLLGRKKGVNTVVSLILTGLSVFCVFIPAVIAGANIYLWSIIVCIYITIMTMLIINGFNKKSLVAGLGCTAGVLVAGILTVILDKIIHLTGATSEETIYLSQNGINIKAIIFAGIIIGAVGAIMDVSESLSSALLELYRKSKNPTFSSLVSSGLVIGRDMMGTMANTLVLAYIGCDLAAALLMITYSSTLSEFLNRESIIVSLLQAITGSMGILLAIPFTTVIAALLYTKTDMTKEINEAEREEESLKFAEKKDKYYIEPANEPSLFDKSE